MANDHAGTEPPYERDLRLAPDYKFFTVRDGSSSAAPRGADALDAARVDIAAATPLELYVVCAQDLAQVHVAVHQEPGTEEAQPMPQWAGPLVFRISFPTGEARIGDITGQAISVPLVSGPGQYVVSLFHRGREDAQQRLAALPHHEFVHGENTEMLLEPVHGVENYYVVIARERT